MFKKKPFFIVFEGVEGCGKSYQSKKLYNNLKKKKISSLLTREPGGTRSAEMIRNLILKDYFNKNYMFKFDDKIEKNDIYEKLYENNNTKELADLLSNILKIDPRKRFNCKQILNHKIFND